MFATVLNALTEETDRDVQTSLVVGWAFRKPDENRWVACERCETDCSVDEEWPSRESTLLTSDMRATLLVHFWRNSTVLRNCSLFSTGTNLHTVRSQISVCCSKFSRKFCFCSFRLLGWLKSPFIGFTKRFLGKIHFTFHVDDFL